MMNRDGKYVTVTDPGTGKSVTANAFSGGHIDREINSMVSPGVGKEMPAPPGSYYIVDNPNPKASHGDWYGLLKIDDRIDDYLDDQGKPRSGIRFHPGSTSHGCVTVPNLDASDKEKWNQIKEMLNGTKPSLIDFRKGPHWWNGTGKIKSYGTLTIK